MRDRKEYTPKEMEEALEAYGSYIEAKGKLETYSVGSLGGILPVNKVVRFANEVNELAEECEKKIPKSLIDKFKIKKVE